MIEHLLSRLLLYTTVVLALTATAHAQRSDPASIGESTQVFATTPSARPDGKPWRLGYVQSGDYSEYPLTLAQIVKGLEKLNWLTLERDIPAGLDGHALWLWLSQHAKSSSLTFVPDAWWAPGNFEVEKRAPTRAAIQHRIATRGDIDLIIAMGTWAGQDMRELGPPVPTVVGSVSDPLAARIIDSVQDSGRDNLHVRVEPQRYQRQLRLFHEIVPFRTLGIVYEDSAAGRTYGAVEPVEEVSRELGFDVKSCHARSSDIPLEQATRNVLDCYRSLAQDQVDAVYITLHRGLTEDAVREVAEILSHARIPSFSLAGSSEVQRGVLLSLAQADMSYVGLFHAETIARILNGAKPRRLSQVWIDPPKIALNLATARAIGFDPPLDILLAADDVYQDIRQPR